MRISIAIRFIATAAILLATFGAQANPSMVVDVQSGTVLSHEDAFKRWYPASITKLMTIYVVLDAVEKGEIALNSPVKFSKAASAQPPSKMYWGPGTVLNFDNAIKILAVKSANDVAMAVAESLAGSVEAFAARMNAQAARLGMTGTHFVNANGLFADGQYSTAHDLALLAMALRRDFPKHAHYFALEGIKYGKEDLANYNLLIGRFAGADGMKTGYICASGFNLVASATREGRTLIAVVLGAAASGKLERLTMRIDGRPIAMLANFITPPGAYSFKTAYDEDYARFSPGVLLQRENLDLLARPEVAWTDSCAAADHPMIERIWREKRTMLRLSIAIGGKARQALARGIFRAERGSTLEDL